MKNVLFVFSLVLLMISCGNDVNEDLGNCDCNTSWDSSITYVADDLVSYNNKCWIAIAQGRGIEPGPWLVNGNDIWEECTE